MDYWTTLFKESWRDSWDLVVGRTIGTVCVAAAVVLASVILYKFKQEHDEARKALRSVAIGLASTLIIFTMIFLWHLLLATPKALVGRHRAQTKSLQETVEAFKREQATSNPVSPTPAGSPAVGYQLEDIALVRTVQTEWDVKIDGMVSKGTLEGKPVAGAKLLAAFRRVTNTEVMSVKDGSVTKLRRSFVEATNRASLLLPNGEQLSYDGNAIEHGKILIDELMTNEPTKIEWNRRLENGDGSSEQKRWLESLPAPDTPTVRSDPIPPRRLGETWVLGPDSEKTLSQRLHSRGVKNILFDNPNANISGEMIGTYTFIDIESWHGERCAVIHKSLSLDFKTTALPENATVNMRGLVAGRSHRSLSRRIDLNQKLSGALRGDFYDFAIFGRRLSGQIIADVEVTMRETVLK